MQAIQKGYTLAPLRRDFVNRVSAPKTESALPVFPFIDVDELATDSPEPQIFFPYANFIMQYINIEAYETDLFHQFCSLSIGPGASFEGQSMSKDQYLTIKAGITAGSKKIDLAPLIDGFGNSANGWVNVGAIDPPIFPWHTRCSQAEVCHSCLCCEGWSLWSQPTRSLLPFSQSRR